MANYYEDYYSEHINSANEKDFLDAIKKHEDETVRYYIPPKEFQFAAISAVDTAKDTVSLIRLDGKEGGVVEYLEYSVESKAIDAWEDTYKNGTQLAIIKRSVNDGKVFPVSDNVKLSVGNRSTLSYKGSLTFTTRQVGSPIAMAKIMEDMIVFRNKQKLQLAVIAGKVQAILTARYIPSDQRIIFKDAGKELAKLPKYSFGGADISHTSSYGYYNVANQGSEVTAQVRVSDSSTGDGAISIAPHIKMRTENGKYRSVVFDESWKQRHARYEQSDFKAGLAAAVQACENNARKLADTMIIVINNPQIFHDNAITELNKLAKKFATHQIGKTEKENIGNAMNALLQFQNITVWDYIDLLWDIVPNGSTNADSKELREKTVSKILTLDFAKLDLPKAKTA